MQDVCVNKGGIRIPCEWNSQKSDLLRCRRPQNTARKVEQVVTKPVDSQLDIRVTSTFDCSWPNTSALTADAGIIASESESSMPTLEWICNVHVFVIYFYNIFYVFSLSPYTALTHE